MKKGVRFGLKRTVKRFDLMKQFGLIITLKVNQCTFVDVNEQTLLDPHGYQSAVIMFSCSLEVSCFIDLILADSWP